MMKTDSAIRLFKKWPVLALLAVATLSVGACVEEEFGAETDLVLETVGQSSTDAGAIEIEGEVVVYSADVAALAGAVRAAAEESDKREVIKDYLTTQERINCVIEDLQKAVDDNKPLNCKGKALVEKKGEHGLMGVADLLEEVASKGSDSAKREYLLGYLEYWDRVQRVDRVTESLSQMKRTKAIPLFGKLVNTIHRFPIMYEGDILVPKKDLNMLLDEFGNLSTDDDRRQLAEDYLGLSG